MQHSKVTSSVCIQLCELCELAFAGLDPCDLLYASAATYRRRWDALLEALLIPKAAAPPAKLRGGAVHSYHSAHLLYLQEVAAENSLKLPQPSRLRVTGAARLPFLLAHASALQPAPRQRDLPLPQAGSAPPLSSCG